MKKPASKANGHAMRTDYDFSEGQRGRYSRRAQKSTNVVVLEPVVAKVFSTSKKVNLALRKVIRERAKLAAH